MRGERGESDGNRQNGKTYEEAFASFRDEVLDILDMKRTGEKFKREQLSKIVLWHPTGFFPVRFRTRGATLRRPGGKLDRDHVYTRKFLADQILAGRTLVRSSRTLARCAMSHPRSMSVLACIKPEWAGTANVAAGIKWYDITENQPNPTESRL